MADTSSGVELAAGWSFWTKDGAPARRVATMGNESREPAFALDTLTPAALPDMEALRSDLLLTGDAWVGLDGRRVDPADIVLRRDDG